MQINNMNNTRYGSLPLRPEEYVSDDDDDDDDDVTTISTLSMSDRFRCGSNSIHTRSMRRPVPITAMLVLPLFVGVVWLGTRFNEYPQPITVTQTSSSLRNNNMIMYGMSNHDRDNVHDNKYGRTHVERHSNGVIDLVDDDYVVNARVRPHDDIDIWDAISIWGINHPRSIRLWAASNEGGKPSSFPQDITFADLAALLVPAYFKDSVDACLSVIIPAPSVEGEPVTSTSVMPGEVYALRKTLLKTRDLFDIFSTVYPTQTNVMTELFIDDTKDLWRILRVYLMDGYRLIGDFQDLSHAKIMYTPEQLADYQVQVWTWKTDFMTFVQENLETIFDYLYTPCNRNTRNHDHCRYAHSHVSHLFWGNTPDKHLPHGNVDKAKHVLARLGNIQLKRAEKYLHKSLTYEYILNSTKATMFTTTSSRNLIERQLESSGNELMSEDSNADEIDENNVENKDEETDESEENGTDPEEIDDDEKDESKEDSAVDIDDEETDDEDEDETDDIDDDDENEESNEDSDDEKNEINDNDSDEYVDVQLIYHNCRKQLRGFLDELSIFGNLLLPNTSVIPELLRNADTGATSHTLDPAAKILTDQAVKKLDETRTVLGDLNDAYVSHQFYQEHDMYPDEQLRLQVSVESKWRHFRKWQTDNDLVGKMHVLRTMMMKPNLTWSLAPSISPIPTSESTVSPITPTSVSPISNAPTIGPTTASPLSEEPTVSPTKNPVTVEPSSSPSSLSSAISVTDAVKEKQHKKKRKNVESPGETTPESDKEE